MRRCRRAAAVTALGLLAAVRPVDGQDGAPVFHSAAPLGQPPEPSTLRNLPSWVRPVASLVVPGSGQLIAGQERGAVYMIVETFLFARYLAFHRQAERESDQYRNLAFTVARAPYAPMMRDTSFAYFEHLEDFIESGPFDEDPGPGFLPASDVRTYNGSIWALARQTFFADPDSIPDPESLEYQLAIDFYRRRAVGDNFSWTWRNAGLEQDLYRQAIRNSDEAARHATQQLGLMLANHLLSAIDAFVSVRLSRNGRPVQIRSSVWSPSDAWRPQGGIRIDVAF